MFLFEKRYDALHDPPVLANAFNGTCQSGQLLLRGYEQELADVSQVVVNSGQAMFQKCCSVDSGTGDEHEAADTMTP